MIVKVLEMLSLMKNSGHSSQVEKPQREPLKLKKPKNTSLKNSNGHVENLNAKNPLQNVGFRDAKSNVNGPSHLCKTVQPKLGAHASDGTGPRNPPDDLNARDKGAYLGNPVSPNFHASIHQMGHLYGQNAFFSSPPQYMGPMGYGSNSTDLNSFYRMHNLRLKDSQMRHSDTGKTPQFCTEHQTVANMVCLTDHKVICSNCALFGVHKGHDYCKFDHFLEECRGKFKTLRSEVEKTEFKWYVQEGGNQGDAARQKVASKKDQLLQQVASALETTLRKVRERHEELKKEIQEKFRRFERIIELRVSHHRNIRDRVADFTRKLESSSAQLEAGDVDFGHLFEVLFQKGPANAFDEVEKIAQEIEIEKNNNTGFIEKELSRYTVDFDQATLAGFLKNQFMRLDCGIDSVKESLRNVTSLGNSYDRNFYSKTPDQVQAKRVLRLVQVDPDSNFEAKLARNIEISKDLELMGSGLGSQGFSNINMSEFLKKSGPQQDQPGDFPANVFHEEAAFSKTERKKEKKVSQLEINFSEKKRPRSRNIREEEIDCINNSSSPSHSKKADSRKMMSFLEDENLMSASPVKSEGSRLAADSGSGLTPKQPRITFEKDRIPTQSDLCDSVPKRDEATGADVHINQFEKTESIIKLLKRRNDSAKQLATPKNKFFRAKQTVLSEVSLNKPRAPSSSKKASLRPQIRDQCDLNLYERGPNQSETKRVKLMSKSNFMGLESSENLYAEKSRKDRRRFKRKTTLSSSAVETQLRASKRASGGRRKILDLRKRRGGSKSINGMTSLLKFNKKSLRINTDDSHMLDKRCC